MAANSFVTPTKIAEAPNAPTKRPQHAPQLDIEDINSGVSMFSGKKGRVKTEARRMAPPGPMRMVTSVEAPFQPEDPRIGLAVTAEAAAMTFGGCNMRAMRNVLSFEQWDDPFFHQALDRLFTHTVEIRNTTPHHDLVAFKDSHYILHLISLNRLTFLATAYPNFHDVAGVESGSFASLRDAMLRSSSFLGVEPSVRAAELYNNHYLKLSVARSARRIGRWVDTVQEILGQVRRARGLLTDVDPDNGHTVQAVADLRDQVEVALGNIDWDILGEAADMLTRGEVKPKSVEWSAP